MTVNEFINCLDFDENDYFYHVTGNGRSDFILEEGLLVDGTNITGTNNILFTTAAPIYPDDVVDEENFKTYFLEDELSNDSIGRDKNEMIIIGSPKFMKKNIVDKLNEVIDGVFYEGIIDNSFIMGYFNIEQEFTPNKDFQYGTDDFYDEHIFSK